MPDQSDSLLGASLSLGAIFAGFLATAQAIVMTLDSPVMKRLKESGLINDLMSYLSHAIYAALGFSIVCLLGYFIKTNTLFFGIVWCFGATVTLTTFYRISNLTMRIFKAS